MANCNRQQLNITFGTDVVLHDRLIFDGETFDPNLSVGIAANLVSSLGKRTALDVQVVDDELLISVPWIEGTLPGCYGLEVTGSCNSKKWATYADSLIKYTTATRVGVSEVTVESDSYDITQEVGYCYSNSPVTFAEVTVDDGYGTPSVDVEYEQRVLSMDFHNLKGNGITDIDVDEQVGDEAVNTVTIKTDADQEGTEFKVRNGSRGNGIASSSEQLSDQDGGINTFTITDDDGTVHEFHSKNGTKGAQGDSAVYDPSSPDTPDFVMANTTGQSTTKAMTQKAITENVTVNKNIFSPTWTTGKGIAPNTGGLYNSEYFDYSNYINIEGCQMLHVPVTKLSHATGYAFYNSSKVYISGGTYEGETEASGDYQYYLVIPPSGAKYIRLTANSRLKSYWTGSYPTLFDVSPIKENLNEIGREEEIFVAFADGKGVECDNGTLNTHTLLAYTGYIDVSKYDELITPLVKSSFTYGCALYDENKVFIEGIAYQKDNESSGVYDYSRIRTNGAKFIRVTGFSHDFPYFEGYPSIYGICDQSEGAEILDIPLAIALVNGWWKSATLSIINDATYVASSVQMYADCDLTIDCDDEFEMDAFYVIDGSLKSIDIYGEPSTGQAYRRHWVVKGGYIYVFQVRKISMADITPDDVYGKIHIRKSAENVINALDIKDAVIANPYWNAPELTKEVIFSTAVDGAGGALRRIPSIVITNNGTYLAATETRTVYADNAQIGIVLARKVSGGNWVYNNILPYAPGNYGKVMNPSFAIAQSGFHAGRIYLFFIAFPITQPNDGYAYLASTEEMDNMYIYSDDDGVTWSSPESTKDAWDTDEWTWVGVSPANGVDIGNGTLAMPTMGRYNDNWYSGVMLFETSDGSSVYSKRSSKAADNESTLFVATNGVIFLNARNENSDHVRSLYAYNPNDNTLQGMPYNEDPNEKCQQSICKCGDIYLRSACNPSSTGVRDNLTIYVSKDGLTWCAALLVNEPTTYGYSVVDAKDSTCVLVYENEGTISFVDLSEYINQFENSASVIGRDVEWRLQKLIEVIKQ